MVSQYSPIRKESASYGTLRVPIPCVKVMSQALLVSLEKQLKQYKYVHKLIKYEELTSNYIVTPIVIEAFGPWAPGS